VSCKSRSLEEIRIFDVHKLLKILALIPNPENSRQIESRQEFAIHRSSGEGQS
jgi:hypothetical protein